MRQFILTRRGADILARLEQIMDNATRALASSAQPGGGHADASGTQIPRGAVASASDREAPSPIRGN